MPASLCSPWTFAAFRAPLHTADDAPFLAEIRALRARILYDHGRRPMFLDEDVQEQDLGAWHFLARRAADGGTSTGDGDDSAGRDAGDGSAGPGPVLGYVRLATPDTGTLFQSRQFLGARDYDALLRAEALAPGEVFEHSRLVVERRARKLGLGLHLNALAIGAAHELGAAAMIGTSGTADGQDRFHERFGFRAVAGTRRYVERYTEDVVIMLHRVAAGAGEYADLVGQYRDVFVAISKDGPAAGLAGSAVTPATAPTAPLTLGTQPAKPITQAPPNRAPNRLPNQAPNRPFLAPSLPTADPTRWKPVLFSPNRDGDRAALATLTRSGRVRELCDTLPAQLDELVTSREPALAGPGAKADRRAAVADQLAGLDPAHYGAWVWYPWSGRLVHLLPREEFRLVRTDRNRTKIDRPEQRRLFGKRIGVVGLSVGSSAALTLAQEGIGGAFRLADFDSLGLSNLNRLRAGVHDLGLPKSVLVARQMFELDPYLDIEIFPHGLAAHTMDAFLGRGSTGGGSTYSTSTGADPLDLLVEECDTPWIKLAAREAARERGVPVVMDCNDRGLLDIERFDLEPERPLLHGRLGALRAADVVHLSPAQRVDLIVAMVDPDRMSPALRTAITAIGRTLSSWPQLASGVALGGALVAEAARRILLGRPCASGRFYVDLEELIAPGRDVGSHPGPAGRPEDGVDQGVSFPTAP
jgi:hypothetical protein